MIHNKWIWGAFALIVAVTFVGGDLISSRSSSGVRGGIGALNDKAVTAQEFEIARMQARLEFQNDPEADIEYETWLRLAVVRFAEELGLSVSDDEIKGALRADPLFAGPNGAFNANRYRAVLAQANLTEATFLELYKLERLMGKVESVVMSGAWVVPSMAMEQARGLSDVYDFRLATYQRTVRDMTEEASAEEIEDYFKGNIEDFRIPERVAVRYVRFAPDAFRSQVTLDESVIQEYYDANEEEYTVSDEEGPRLLTLEEARMMIEGKLSMQEARGLAAQAATAFADLFYAGTGINESSDFERIAGIQGWQVHTTALFSAASPPIAVEWLPAFAAAAFDLNPASLRDQFSDVVVGRNASYVLAFHERQESSLPTLDDVRGTVLARVQERARSRAFAEVVDKASLAVSGAVKDGEMFEDAAVAHGFTVGTNITLTAAGAYTALENGNLIAMRLMRLNAGDLSTPLFMDGGANLIFVDQRSPGDTVQNTVMAAQLSHQLRMNLAELSRTAWRKDNITAMNAVMGDGHPVGPSLPRGNDE